MKFTAILLLVALAAVAVVASSHHKGLTTPLTSGVLADKSRAEIIATVNKAKSSWTAGVNRKFTNKPFSYTAGLCGVKITNPNARFQNAPYKTITGYDVAAIPDSFDSRTQWSNCPSIGEIRDQSDCGSCWAFGAVEAGSDRICIETGKQAHLSAEDLTSCCDSCGMGCDGGDPSAAWSWFTTTGVVTGGNYDDFSWCSSYSLPNCDHHLNHTGHYQPCPAQEYNTPTCPTACDSNSTYATPYAQDKHIFATAYSVAADVSQIQQEIMTNGPVEAAFDVYADFESYTGGVYQHVTGDYLGGHAVKILGWGVDSASNLPYWLVANSWNNDWGENGFFRILRGADECGIEDNIVAGLFTQAKAKQQKKHKHH